MGWAGLHLSALCHGALQLSLLSQSALSHLPARQGAELACQATGGALAGALLPGDLHASRGTTDHRPPAPAAPLRTALPQFGDGVAAVGGRSAVPGWADRDGGRAADVDAGPALPSAHSLPRAGWGVCIRGGPMGASQGPLPGACQAAREVVSRQDACGVAAVEVGGGGGAGSLGQSMGGGLPRGGEWRGSVEVFGALRLSCCA